MHAQNIDVLSAQNALEKAKAVSNIWRHKGCYQRQHKGHM